jgi:transcriptional regulator with PAS, ATPase and Fis domain
MTSDWREQPGVERALIGTSLPFVRLMALVDQIAARSETVLLIGESGTRKELLARTTHERSPRHASPFVAVHCGRNPEFMESEFFGYEKGAFTGAHSSKAGLFERAAGGTLFLDEIALLDPPLQVHLRHALHSSRFYRLGGTKPFRVDVRIISATNQDVARMCREKLFRKDLYSLLSGVTVQVPPLRERGREDIEPLARYFLEVAAAKHNRRVNGFSDEAMRALVTYPWPGNEQELEHVVERAVTVIGSGELIAMSDLPPELQPGP